MQSPEIIAKLASNSGHIEKEQILFDAFMKGERDFFTGALLAYDPLITFGVARVAEIVEDDGEPGTLTFAAFLQLAHKLRRRELTGNAARNAIHNAAEQCDAKTWNMFYRRILLKDFKAGIQASTINKVLKKVAQAHPEASKFVIPVFACQLAHDGTDEAHAKKIKGKKLLDVKLDGARLLTVLDKEAGTVTQYTRTGNLVENFTEIREALAKLLPHLPGSIVLDGEVVGASFQQLMTQLNRKVGKNTADARLALFDIVPLDDFRAGSCSIPQRTRHETLSALATSGLLRLCDDLAYVIPKVEVDLDTPEGREALREFNIKALEAGYEGVMVKDPEAPYRCKRSDAWLKIKPVISVSLTIVDVEEGKPDGKYVGMMGALVCEGEDCGKEIEVNVGSGYSDDQRIDFWNRRHELKGMIVEIEADAFTQSQTGGKWSLRFPRWKGFRGTQPGEKI